MMKLIYTEFIKVKRYHILWVGLLLSFFSPFLSVYQLSFLHSDVTVQDLINNTIWNNTILFFPLISVIIGGYIINREYTDDTLKNILTVPVKRRSFVTSKIITVFFMSILFGLCDFLFTMVIATLMNCAGINIKIIFISMWQIIGMGIFSTIAVSPIIIFSAGKQDSYLGGIVLTFVYAYVGSFFAGRNLQDVYPTTVGLGLVKYTGETGNGHVSYHIDMELMVIILLVIISSAMLRLMNHYKNP